LKDKIEKLLEVWAKETKRIFGVQRNRYYKWEALQVGLSDCEHYREPIPHGAANPRNIFNRIYRQQTQLKQHLPTSKEELLDSAFPTTPTALKNYDYAF